MAKHTLRGPIRVSRSGGIPRAKVTRRSSNPRRNTLVRGFGLSRMRVRKSKSN